MAEAVVKVMKDEKVKGPRGKDFGLVFLGPLPSPGTVANKLSQTPKSSMLRHLTQMLADIGQKQ